MVRVFCTAAAVHEKDSVTDVGDVLDSTMQLKDEALALSSFPQPHTD